MCVVRKHAFLGTEIRKCNASKSVLSRAPRTSKSQPEPDCRFLVRGSVLKRIRYYRRRLVRNRALRKAG